MNLSPMIEQLRHERDELADSLRELIAAVRAEQRRQASGEPGFTASTVEYRLAAKRP